MMASVLQFIRENRDSLFGGVSVLSVLLAFFGWRWQKREVLRVDPKKFSEACDLLASGGGFSPDVGHYRRQGKIGVRPAKLRVLCHNLASTPAILDEIKLLNKDSSEVVSRVDGDAKRIDSHGSVEVEIPVGTHDAPCYQPPQWRAAVIVKTIRKKSFSSRTFEFSELA